MLGNRAFRKMFGRKKGQVTVEWSKMHSEELYYLHSSANIIREIKSTNGMWRGWWRLDVHTGFWWANMRERDHTARPRHRKKVLLKWILKKLDRDDD